MKCNNCNVELAPYLDRCPLCHKKCEKINNDSVYNNIIETFSTKVNIIYFSRLSMKLLFLSNIICIICNLIINKRISWSYYVLFSTLYIFSFYLYLIMSNKKLAFIINMFFLELLLFMISYLTNSIRWFIYLVGPFILISVLFILLNIYLSRFKNILRNFSCLLVYISLCLNIINGLIILYNTNTFNLTWSLYSSLTILIISIILLILSFNRNISEQIEKRFFI